MQSIWSVWCSDKVQVQPAVKISKIALVFALIVEPLQKVQRLHHKRDGHPPQLSAHCMCFLSSAASHAAPAVAPAAEKASELRDCSLLGSKWSPKSYRWSIDSQDAAAWIQMENKRLIVVSIPGSLWSQSQAHRGLIPRLNVVSFPGSTWSRSQAHCGLIPRLNMVSFPGSLWSHSQAHAHM
eukprot:Em0001g389a